MTRRDFIAALGAGAATLAGCRCPFGGARHPIALQLYSIHKLMWAETPPEEAFAKIRDIGYDGVEFAGVGGRNARQIRKLLEDAGLRGMGTHLSRLEQFQGDKLKANLDFCAEAGIESLTNAAARFRTPAEARAYAEVMGAAAETARAWNIPVSVHNHCDELTLKFDGVSAWDCMLGQAGTVLQQQLDSGQVMKVGDDPVERVRRYRGRNFSAHMKENMPSEWGFFGVPPDNGGKVVPWRDLVMAYEDDPSFRWYVVESACKPDSLVPAERNYGFLSALVESI